MPKVRLSIALLLACSGVALAANNAIPQGSLQDLHQRFPGVRTIDQAGRISHIYGVPMTAGATPEEAAQSWVNTYGASLGGGTELVNDWTTITGDSRHTVVSYRQKMRGFDVEYANVRVLVLNAPPQGGPPRVVMVTSSILPVLEEDAFVATVQPEQALALVRAMPMYRNIPQWTDPALMVWQGDATTPAGLVWRFNGLSPNPADAVDFGFYVHAGTGRLIKVENQVHTQGGTAITGRAQARVTTGLLPDIATNPPTLVDMPEIRAALSASGGSVFTDRQGLFSITPAGTGPFNLTVSTGPVSLGGRWVEVVPQTGISQVQTLVSGVTPGTDVGNVLLNPAPSEFLTAQANAFYWTTLTHNFMKDRAPGFNAISIPLRANTGVAGTCNANFQSGNLTINFFNAGGGCRNTAFASVVSHEYGHFIVNRLNLAQGNFGEGFGDAVSILLIDDNIIGREFRDTGAFVRDPVGANVQAPCTGGTSVHFCGQILGATWARTKDNFKAALTTQVGLDRVRQLFVTWATATVGWGPSGSAGQNLNFMATEMLVADDDDGIIGNGTPNRALICSATSLASIQCPPLELVAISFPNGRPTEIVPNVATNIDVAVQNVAGTQDPSSARLFTRVAGASTFTSSVLPELSPGLYRATLDPLPCPQRVDWYVQIATTTGTVSSAPTTAPASVFSATATSGALAPAVTVADLNFDTNRNWTVVNATTLTTGGWERVTPAVQNAGNTFAPPTGDGGSGFAWVTDNRVGTVDGAFDIDGGTTTLTSNVFDLGGAATAQLSVARWFRTTAADDRLEIQVSADNGSTWVTMERLNAALNGWQTRTFDVGAFVPLTSQMQFRFIAADEGTGTVVEAGIDSFRLTTRACVSVACYADCDGSGGAAPLSPADFTCFLGKYRAGDVYADCDGSGGAAPLSPADFTCFLGKYRAGCN